MGEGGSSTLPPQVFSTRQQAYSRTANRCGENSTAVNPRADYSALVTIGYAGVSMALTALKRLCRGIDLVVMLMGKAASYMMPLLAFVVAFEVFSRYFLNSPTIWAYDLSLFMFGYIAALGGAYAQQKKVHINVDILYLNVPRKTQRMFNLISYSLGIFFLWIVADMSIGKLLEAIEFDYRRESEWAPPMYHFWVMSLIACGLFIAQLGRDILVDIYYIFTGKDLLAQEDSDGD